MAVDLARSTSDHSHFTLTQISIVLLLTLLSTTTAVGAVNVSTVLAAYPSLSDFASLLSHTAVAGDIAARSSLTILAVPNTYLHSSSSLLAAPSSVSTTTLADVVRYHVLLNYLTWSDLRRIPPSGSLFTTLYQTTGRATNNLGSLNLTYDPRKDVVSVHPPSPNPNNLTAVVISLVKTIPYNLSIFTVSELLTPYGFNLMASETKPSNSGLNITKALVDGHNFNVAASMLAASGVVEEFEADEGGAGLTLFIPTDEAFADLPSSVQLQALPADRKALVLKFHVLHSYYPLGSLQSIVNPVQPTLATEDNGAGSYTLNISRVNGSVALNSGIVVAVVTQTVFDQNPVAIFGISNVLLPREIFGADEGNVGVKNASRGGGKVAQPPQVTLTVAPEGSPEMLAPPSHLSSESSSSSAGVREEISGGNVQRVVISLGFAVFCCCIGNLYL
ncbi:hypothetical protein Droror1_Dr00004317 [Drosera rotundifolia]